jgi:hypothetical protein
MAIKFVENAGSNQRRLNVRQWQVKKKGFAGKPCNKNVVSLSRF